jgi:hypothetical protein
MRGFVVGIMFMGLMDHINIMDASDIIILIQVVSVAISGWIIAL